MVDLASAPYNTADGIQEYLKDGLRGLHRLLWHREAVRIPDATLRFREYVVARRYLLDALGNCVLLDPPLPDTVPDVVEDYTARLSLDRLTTWTHVKLPEPTISCSVCGVGWTLEDVHTALHAYEDNTYYHAECQKYHLDRRYLSLFQDAFNEAGAKRCTFIPIPNEYWASPTSPSWYLVRIMGYRGSVKIGRRKNVYSVDWAHNGAQLIVTEDDVTKNSHCVHAWTKEKLVQYLTTLIPQLIPC